MSVSEEVSSQELQALDNFVQEWQREDGSYLQTKIKTLVAEYLADTKPHKKPQLATIVVKLKDLDIQSVVVNLHSTVLALKRQMECLGQLRTTGAGRRPLGSGRGDI